MVIKKGKAAKASRSKEKHVMQSNFCSNLKAIYFSKDKASFYRGIERMADSYSEALTSREGVQDFLEELKFRMDLLIDNKTCQTSRVHCDVRYSADEERVFYFLMHQYPEKVIMRKFCCVELLFLLLLPIVRPIELKENDEDQDSMTRMVEYEYYFKSETLIYEANRKAEGIKRIIEATIEFKLLHYDENANVLGRYRLKKCIRGPCKQALEDVLVDFSQGGHHLEGLFVVRQNGTEQKSSLLPEWNLLTGVATTIHNPAKADGNRQRQVVKTPFGVCDYRSARPEDKVYTKTINNCRVDLDSNHDLVPGITTTYYHQHVAFRQNQRVDADIIYIDATEDFHIMGALHEKWNLYVKSTVFMELTDRKRLYVKEICDPDAMCGDCAATTFAGQPLGSDWREYTKRFRFLPPNESLLSDRGRTKLQALVEEYRRVRHGSMVSVERTRVLNAILDVVLHADVSEIEAVVGHILNRALLKDLVQMFASAGGSKKVTGLRKLLESPMLRPFVLTYVNALAHTIRPSPPLIDELKSWLADLRSRSAMPQLQESLLATIATLARRRCGRSRLAADACNSLKDNTTSWLWTKLVDECVESSDNFACKLFALNTLTNLPIQPSCEYALKFVCSADAHSRDLQKAALRLLRKCDASHISPEGLQRLVNVFADSCVSQQSLEESAMAVDVLLEAVLLSDLEEDQRRVGSHLLRHVADVSATRASEYFTAEKLSYFYDAVRSLRQSSPRVNAYWSGLRKQRAFRPNYSQLALNASTATQRNVFGVLPVKKPIQIGGTTKTIFSRGFPKQIEYSLNYLTASNDVTEGKYRLVLGELINFYFTSAFSKPRPDNVLYGFALLGHSVPVGELQESALFRAPDSDDADEEDDEDSERSPTDEKRSLREEFHNVVYRNLDGIIPLLSGLAIKVRTIGSASLSMAHERVENRRVEDHDARIGVSLVLDGSVELLSAEGGRLGRMTSELSVDFGVNGFLRLLPPVQFSQYATHLNVTDTTVRHTVKFHLPAKSAKSSKKKKGSVRGVARERRIAGVCHAPSPQIHTELLAV